MVKKFRLRKYLLRVKHRPFFLLPGSILKFFYNLKISIKQKKLLFFIDYSDHVSNILFLLSVKNLLSYTIVKKNSKLVYCLVRLNPVFFIKENRVAEIKIFTYPLVVKSFNHFRYTLRFLLRSYVYSKDKFQLYFLFLNCFNNSFFLLSFSDLFFFFKRGYFSKRCMLIMVLRV